MHYERQRGQVLLMTILLLSLAFTLASFLAGAVITYQIHSAAEVTNATAAIFAADSGLQCGLYQQAVATSFACPIDTTSKKDATGNPIVELSNAATYTSTTTVANGSTDIVSRGMFRDTARGLEASF
ncbi:MAG: hypothetical protein KGI50_00815 [Patescibacteria group bacterium]|nr:hypothetical protein [Patescibacteria group bacterium]MDE2438105.1 hypothetical protein [Patescibacteria group bacterium]